jgi:hypothetical protein
MSTSVRSIYGANAVFKFTIDDVLNRYIPPNRLHRLPRPLRFFLGKHSVKPVGDYWIWLQILVATFGGLTLLEGVFKSHTAFSAHHPPLVIASYGATAILCFNTVHSPLAQPRNIIMGHFVASLIGVGFQKLFSLSQGGQDHYWLCGGLSVAVSSVVMSILNCIHPPAGASALLPAIDERTREMSWWYLPIQLVSSVLMTAAALLLGNILRQYPMYWWTPAPLGQVIHSDSEEVISSESSIEGDKEGVTFIPGDIIQITSTDITVPDYLDLDELDIEWLNNFKNKLIDQD